MSGVDSSCSADPPTRSTPRYAFPPFEMPTSKASICERDTELRSRIQRELQLATLQHPACWDESWRSLLLVGILLKGSVEQLEDHPYIYERWWTHDVNGPNMKLLFANHDGTSMVLLGTSVWDAPDSLSARWSEVSMQLQRFFTDCLTLFEGIRMRSVVVSCWDENVRESFMKGVGELEKCWRYGTAFML